MNKKNKKKSNTKNSAYNLHAHVFQPRVVAVYPFAHSSPTELHLILKMPFCVRIVVHDSLSNKYKKTITN